jgi:hypothetical protein
LIWEERNEKDEFKGGNIHIIIEEHKEKKLRDLVYFFFYKHKYSFIQIEIYIDHYKFKIAKN